MKLIDPINDWKEHPDMKFTKRLRASIIARSRFIEDLIIEQSQHGLTQYVILGAGLDTFAQRRPDSTAMSHTAAKHMPFSYPAFILKRIVGEIAFRSLRILPR